MAAIEHGLANMVGHGDMSDYKSGRLCMIELPCDGPMRIVKVDNRPYLWRTSESVVLLHTTTGQAPGDELFVQLLCDEDGMWTQKGKPNKHVPGLWGDCYVMCVIDSTPPEPENNNDEWPGASLSFRTGERIPHNLIARILSSCYRHSLMLSTFHDFFHNFLGEVSRKYRNRLADTNIDTRQIGDVLMACLRSMKHPHIETTTIAACMLSPEHPDIMIKSRDALAYAIDCVLDALYDWSSVHGHGIALQWNRSIPDIIPEALANPSLTCNEFGHKMQPLLVALYEDYFRRLDTLAESNAEAERRKAEAERRDREAAAKRNAEQAKKAQRLLEERIARLEAEDRRPYTKSGTQRLQQKGLTNRSRTRTKEEQAVHDHHVSDEDKACRTAVWEAKQELAHLTSETNRLEKAYTQMRDEQQHQGAAAALRNHVVPGKTTMGSFFPDA